MHIYIHVASRVSVMTIIHSIMLKMAAPVTKHCSNAPKTRKVYVIEKTNGMKTCTNGLQILIKGGNSIFRLKKQWNTIIRSENIDFVYMLMEAKSVLLSGTEIFNVMVQIFLHT